MTSKAPCARRFSFPALIEPDGTGGFMASFRDVPEALTDGGSFDEAVELARDALITAADFYIEDRRAFPAASAPRGGEVLIDLPLSVVSKMLLLNAMIEKNVRPAELARRMGISRQEASRLTDLHHTTKIDTIEKAFYALGMRVELVVS